MKYGLPEVPTVYTCGITLAQHIMEIFQFAALGLPY